MRRSWAVLLAVTLAGTLCSSEALPLSDEQSSLSVPLGGKNFTQSVAGGIWFIKHYSPRCKHCKKMAPLWAELSHTYEPQATSQKFHFGEVNCLEEPDLCDQHDISRYPSVILYKNGDREDEYEGEMEREPMTTYINKKLDKLAPIKDDQPPVKKENALKADPSVESTNKTTPPAKDSDTTVVAKSASPSAAQSTHVNNPEGHDVALSGATFDAMLSKGPWFVKFFAPWCGHCQHLAPTWVELGKSLRGKMNVGDVDCTVESTLCSDQGIRGYPTLRLFVNGVSTEYSGGRDLESLEKFALKAVNNPVTELLAGQIDSVKEEHDVFFVLSQTSADDASAHLYTTVAQSMFASAAYYYTHDKATMAKLHLPAAPSLAVYKDDKIIAYGGSLSDKEAMRAFIEQHRYPALVEVTDMNARDILDSEHLVVLGLLAPKRAGFDRVKKELREAALEYARQVEQGNFKETEHEQLRFAWLDGVHYSKYITKAYNINDTQLPTMVIIHKREDEYYDTGADGTRLRLTRSEILAALAAIRAGKLRAKSSTNIIASTFKGGMKKLSHLGNAAASNPFLALFGVLAFFAVVMFMVRRNAHGNYARVDPKAD